MAVHDRSRIRSSWPDSISPPAHDPAGWLVTRVLGTSASAGTMLACPMSQTWPSSPDARSSEAEPAWRRAVSFPPEERLSLPGHPWVIPGLEPPDVHFPDHVRPLGGLAQRPHKLLEGRGVRRRELEPREEVEGLTEIAAVVQTAGEVVVSRGPRTCPVSSHSREHQAYLVAGQSAGLCPGIRRR